MQGVLTGFAIIGAIILAGYLLERSGVAGPKGQFVLGRVTFFLATPCLMFFTLSHTPVATLFSYRLWMAAASAAAAALAFLLLSSLVRRLRGRERRGIGELTIGAMTASMLNSNNIGLPVAIYVFGSYDEVVPILLFQLLIMSPIALTILDAARTGSFTVWGVLRQPLTNPLVIGAGLGALVSVTGIAIPEAVFEPFHLIGNAAIPMILLAFGMSLRGARPMSAGAASGDIAVATLTKLALMPVFAYLLGAFVFGLSGPALAGAVMVSALPTAQNVFNYASRYGIAEAMSRDTVLFTTVLAVPALSLIAALLL